jgi:hypothetical protein
MMHSPRTSLRHEHLQREKLRIEASPTIGATFPELKSLTVDLAYYDQEGRSRSSQIKYTANLDHARSAFQFGCHNHECVGGNFDLSIVLAQAVAARHTCASGEVRCEGWRSRTTIDTVPCHNILRYALTLEY